MPPALCGAGPRSELKDEDYKELYKSISGDWEDPLFWFHTKAEGSLEYTTLFYVPSKAPLDLYQAEYKGGVKLYVKRVFIMDDSGNCCRSICASCAASSTAKICRSM
jgi:HSP90 family molecular chaperone